MIQKYLLVNNSLGIKDKPFLWIHIHNDTSIIPDVNQRKWVNYLSRNTKELNKDLQGIVIKKTSRRFRPLGVGSNLKVNL